MAKMAEGRRALARVAELERENEQLRDEVADLNIALAESRGDVSRETEDDVSRETAPAKKAAPPARKR
jgi:hypothetical protein